MIRTVDQNWPIIDFHAHIRPPWWTFKISAWRRGLGSRLVSEMGKKLTDPQALLRATEAGGVMLRLLSSTVEGVSEFSGPVAHDEIRRQNDYLAELAAQHPGKLAALATVDAFSGERAAREAERALTELGHVGIVIDSARDGHFAGSAITRPIFEAAAQLKAPILVHPVAAPNAAALLRRRRAAPATPSVAVTSTAWPFSPSLRVAFSRTFPISTSSSPALAWER